ncbi:MAG TPA: bacteriocin fulvocin C-related protein [Pyrinomonadaceae bacterium]|nr:bacteriocin fulvocin C-related protein [Pyrinomonadaceae bacterium]
MPSSIMVGNAVFDNYLKVASLSRNKRASVFSKFSNEEKATFIKVNLALQLVKRPNITKEQQEFVLDAISKVSADIYENSDAEKARMNEQNGREIENRALGLFAYKELGDFIEPLMSNKDQEAALVQKYQDLLKNGDSTRRKIAKEMPVNDRVNIWKVQLAYHLATGKFSKVQKAFISEWLISLSPETFESRANLTAEEEAKALKSLESKIFSVFTREEGFAIFMTIGIQESIPDDPIDPIEGGSCNCRWYCCASGNCAGGCTHKPNRCGPFDDWECTGRCEHPSDH